MALAFVSACSPPMSGTSVDEPIETDSNMAHNKHALIGENRQQDESDITLLKAVDSRGRPVTGVRVIGFETAIEGTSVGEIGRTDRKGVLRTTVAEPPFLGFAPDGRAAVSFKGSKLVFGKVGDIVVRTKGESGRPIAGRLITLIPTQDARAIKNYGNLVYLREVAQNVQRLVSRKTDSKGIAVFHKMPIGGKFSVLLSSTPPADTLFAGSVRPGKVSDLLIAQDRQIDGYVYDGKMRPISGAELGIDYSSFDAMAPDRSFRSAKTDAHGHYRFQNLPNCKLGVTTSAPGTWIANSRVNGGAWTPKGLLGTPLPGWDSVMCYEVGTSDEPQTRVTRIDFRLDKPIKVRVAFTNPRHVALDNFCISASVAGQENVAGIQVYSGIQNLQNTFGVGQGKYDLVLRTRDFDPKGLYILRSIEAHEGDTFDFQFEVPVEPSIRQHARSNSKTAR